MKIFNMKALKNKLNQYELWAKSGMINGKKVVNIFEVSHLLGLSVEEICKYQIKRNSK